MDADQYQAVHDLILEIIDHDAAKTDMEARCEIERIPRSSPQCITRWLPVSHVAGSEVT
jgi:hypothetical protein